MHGFHWTAWSKFDSLYKKHIFLINKSDFLNVYIILEYEATQYALLLLKQGNNIDLCFQIQINMGHLGALMLE